MLVTDNAGRIVRTFGATVDYYTDPAGGIARYYRLQPGCVPYFLGWDRATSDASCRNWGARSEQIGNPDFAGYDSKEFSTVADLFNWPRHSTTDVTELWSQILEAARASYG